MQVIIAIFLYWLKFELYLNICYVFENVLCSSKTNVYSADVYLIHLIYDVISFRYLYLFFVGLAWKLVRVEY